MRKLMAQVRAFHEKFALPIEPMPRFPQFKRQGLRMDLIKEEHRELQDAFYNQDLVAYADALGDLCYVLVGAALEHGIPLTEVLDEIHRSNMTKVWPDGTVHYREDGKVLKPPSYSPADIESVLLRFSAKPCPTCCAPMPRNHQGLWLCQTCK